MNAFSSFHRWLGRRLLAVELKCNGRESRSHTSAAWQSRSILWAARTRILALYALLLLLFEIASIIAFRHFLFLHALGIVALISC